MKKCATCAAAVEDWVGQCRDCRRRWYTEGGWSAYPAGEEQADGLSALEWLAGQALAGAARRTAGGGWEHEQDRARVRESLAQEAVALAKRTLELLALERYPPRPAAPSPEPPPEAPFVEATAETPEPAIGDAGDIPF